MKYDGGEHSIRAVSMTAPGASADFVAPIPGGEYSFCSSVGAGGEL
jgi:hypothetical protein